MRAAQIKGRIVRLLNKTFYALCINKAFFALVRFIVGNNKLVVKVRIRFGKSAQFFVVRR